MIACDGASSGIRQQLGIAFEDLVFDEPWLVVDLQVNGCSASAKLPETAAQFCDPSRPTTFIIGPGHHRRFEIMLLPGEDPREMEEPEQVWRLLARWIKPDDATLWRAASYRFHALVAGEWRRGSRIPRRRCRPSAAALYRPGHVPGHSRCRKSGLETRPGSARPFRRSAARHLWRGTREHVRELTTRIKAIGHVICERDPVAAEARDARILAEGGGHPRTVTRQEIVPPLQKACWRSRAACGARHAVSAALDERRAGRRLLDVACGTGWRLVIGDGRGLALTPAIESQARVLEMRVIRIGPASGPAKSGTVEESRRRCRAMVRRHVLAAAIVRPDHYVFGVSSDATALAAMLAELSSRLQ